MGRLEHEARRRRRKGYLQDAVLGTLAVSGLIAWMLIAPNTLQLLGGFGYGKRRFAEQAKSAAGRLVKKGYARFEERAGKKYLRITPAGETYLRRVSEMQSSSKPKRWDGRWRMVVFDIPQHQRPLRDRLRALVGHRGFIQLQKSVWVYPYDCEELITLIKAELGAGKAVLYAIVESIEYEKPLLDHFKLKRK